MEDAHALEVPMDEINVCAEFRRVAEHDRSRSGQLNLDIVDNFAGLVLMTRMRSDSPTASSTLWVIKITVGRRRSHSASRSVRT
jgi:hypothetical protein